jgi:hypothetical protein
MKMHKLWTTFRNHSRLIYRLLLALFLISAVVTLVALRHNNETMIALRGDLYVADKDNGDVNTALNNLRQYVYSHMNTNLSSGGDAIKPPIQLKYTYQRLQAASQAGVNAANSQIYTDAEYYCQQQDPTDFSGHNRVPCVTAYVTSHGTTAKAIPVALYEFDFVSPSWSPDFAGWNLVLSILLFIGMVFSYLVMRLTPRYT